MAVRNVAVFSLSWQWEKKKGSVAVAVFSFTAQSSWLTAFSVFSEEGRESQLAVIVFLLET